MSKELYAQSSLHRMVRYDARSEILTSLGDLSGVRLRGNQVIVAPYVQSGILWNEKLGFPLEERLSVDSLCDLYASNKGFRAHSLSKESIYQGKVALVVAIGEDVAMEPCERCGGEGWVPISVVPLQQGQVLELGTVINPVEIKKVCPVCHGATKIRSRKTMPGSWIFTLQENTRGVSLRGLGWQKSRVLKALDIDYDGWPCRFVYETDIYGDVDDPDMVV